MDFVMPFDPRLICICKLVIEHSSFKIWCTLPVRAKEWTNKEIQNLTHSKHTFNMWLTHMKNQHPNFAENFANEKKYDLSSLFFSI